MPGKTYNTFFTEWLRKDFDYWRLLCRNQRFRDDMAAYIRKVVRNRHKPTYHPVNRDYEEERQATNRRLNKFFKSETELKSRWGLDEVPRHLWWESEAPVSIQTLEEWYLRAREKDDFRCRHKPVRIMERTPDTSQQNLWLVTFRVDSSFPIDSLLAGFGEELRRWLLEREFRRRGARWQISLRQPKRRRPDTLDFQLRVFDLVQGTSTHEPLTFRQVAARLRQPASTVRDACWTVYRKLGIPKHPKDRPLPPDPGPPSKCSNSRCRSARTVEEFCHVHRQYAEQDYVSQRDSLLQNPQSPSNSE